MIDYRRSSSPLDNLSKIAARVNPRFARQKNGRSRAPLRLFSLDWSTVFK
jgi:hypothetical protein